MRINHTKGKWKVITAAEKDVIFGGEPRNKSRLIVDDNIDLPWSIADLCGGQPNEKDDATLLARVLEIPHECDDPLCPGNINRQKMNLFNAMLAILERIDAGLDADSHPVLSLPSVVSFARALITSSEAEK